MCILEDSKLFCAHSITCIPRGTLRVALSLHDAEISLQTCRWSVILLPYCCCKITRVGKRSGNKSSAFSTQTEEENAFITRLSSQKSLYRIWLCYSFQFHGLHLMYSDFLLSLWDENTKAFYLLSDLHYALRLHRKMKLMFQFEWNISSK